MKRSQVVSFVVATIIVACMAYFPNMRLGFPTPSTTEGVVATTPSSTVDEKEDETTTRPTSSDLSSSQDGAKKEDSESEREQTLVEEDGTSATSDLHITTNTSSDPPSTVTVSEDGTYTSKDEVALYLHLYGHLPSNYITKTKAKNAGWVSTEGNLDEVCPGKSIGGGTYYNDGLDGEQLLPEARGRTWKECDINYHGGFRGSERIVYSSDGLIFYTSDHYQTFEQLY